MVKKNLLDFRCRLGHKTCYSKQKWKNGSVDINIKTIKTRCTERRLYRESKHMSLCMSQKISEYLNNGTCKKPEEDNLVITCEEVQLNNTTTNNSFFKYIAFLLFLFILLLIISIFIAFIVFIVFTYFIFIEFIVNEFLKVLEFIKLTIHMNLPFAIGDTFLI